MLAVVWIVHLYGAISSPVQMHNNFLAPECICTVYIVRWYVASPSGPLPSLFKLCHRGQDGPAPVSHVLHRLIGRTIIKSSCLKPQGLEP